HELSPLHVELEISRQRRVVDRSRAPDPTEVPLQRCEAPAQGLGIAEPLEKASDVGHFKPGDVEAELRLQPPALPCAVGSERALRAREHEPLDAPVEHLVDGDQLEPAEIVPAEDQLVGDDVAPGQSARGRLVLHTGRGRGQAEILEPSEEAPEAFRTPGDLARKLSRQNSREPYLAFRARAQRDIVQAAASEVELAEV